MKKRTKLRIQWRDNLLSKYEERIMNLEYLLRLAGCYVTNNEPLSKSIHEELKNPNVVKPTTTPAK